jgi:phospholipid/cholesterol/gamma-HCH transport system substrate-binding protein
MNQRAMQFRVGVMVLGTILIAAVLVAMFGGLSSPFRKTYTLEVKFPSAPGLSVGSPVRKSGIRIGEVSKIAFADDDQVLVTLQIDAKYRLHDNETCWLRNGLLGDAWLEFEPKQAAGPPAGSVVKPAGS